MSALFHIPLVLAPPSWSALCLTSTLTIWEFGKATELLSIYFPGLCVKSEGWGARNSAPQKHPRRHLTKAGPIVRTAKVLKPLAGSILGRSSSFFLLRSWFNMYPQRRNAAQQAHTNNGRTTENFNLKHERSTETWLCWWERRGDATQYAPVRDSCNNQKRAHPRPHLKRV